MNSCCNITINFFVVNIIVIIIVVIFISMVMWFWASGKGLGKGGGVVVTPKLQPTAIENSHELVRMCRADHTPLVGIRAAASIQAFRWWTHFKHTQGRILPCVCKCDNVILFNQTVRHCKKLVCSMRSGTCCGNSGYIPLSIDPSHRK